MLYNIITNYNEKKRSEATQTLRAGCSKADPQTNKHTNKQTDRQGRLHYTAISYSNTTNDFKNKSDKLQSTKSSKNTNDTILHELLTF